MRAEWIDADAVVESETRAQFDANFERWFPRVARWIALRVRDADERERLLMEVFVCAAPLLVAPIGELRLGRVLLRIARVSLARSARIRSTGPP